MTRTDRNVNHCRFGKVWNGWQRGYVNCNMRVTNGGYCHHHTPKVLKIVRTKSYAVTLTRVA